MPKVKLALLMLLLVMLISPRLSCSSTAHHGNESLIAIIAYEGGMTSEVQLLRSFIDDYMAKTVIGSCTLNMLMPLYRHLSSLIIEHIRNNQYLRAITIVALRPLIFSLEVACLVHQIFSFNPEIGVMIFMFTSSVLIGLFHISPWLLITSAIGRSGAKLRKKMRKLCMLSALLTLIIAIIMAFAVDYSHITIIEMSSPIFIASSIAFGAFATSFIVIKLIEKIVEVSIGGKALP